ncbi:MAG: glycosyltransferase family 2 protein [Pseudobdellovibrio sp.]
MMPAVSIVIPSLGHLSSIRRLLESISKQSFELKTLEIFLVINGKVNENLKIELSELVKEYHFRLEVIFLELRGVNLARNYGLKAALSEIVIFFDDDCYVQDAKFIQKHQEFHQTNADIFAFGGGYILPAEPNFLDYMYNYLQMKWLYSGIQAVDKRSIQLTRILLGGNFSIKKTMAVQNNLLFDEAIAYGGSEYEFFRQSYIAQMPMALGSCNVVHVTHESLSSVTRKLFKQGRGKAHIDIKYGDFSDIQKAQYKESFSILQKISMLYFNYVFWSGYYAFKKSPHGLLVHMYKDFVSFLNTTRYQLLNKISKQISFKRNDGDRF